MQRNNSQCDLESAAASTVNQKHKEVPHFAVGCRFQMCIFNARIEEEVTVQGMQDQRPTIWEHLLLQSFLLTWAKWAKPPNSRDSVSSNWPISIFFPLAQCWLRDGQVAQGSPQEFVQEIFFELGSRSSFITQCVPEK